MENTTKTSPAVTYARACRYCGSTRLVQQANVFLCCRACGAEQSPVGVRTVVVMPSPGDDVVYVPACAACGSVARSAPGASAIGVCAQCGTGAVVAQAMPNVTQHGPWQLVRWDCGMSYETVIYYGAGVLGARGCEVDQDTTVYLYLSSTDHHVALGAMDSEGDYTDWGQVDLACKNGVGGVWSRAQLRGACAQLAAVHGLQELDQLMAAVDQAWLYLAPMADR